MTTEAAADAGPARDLTVEEKIQQLRELFVDAPEVGKKALENVLSRLASDASRSRRLRWRAPGGSGAGWARSRS